MPWVKLSDDWYDNPKHIAAGPLGNAMWVTALSWCLRNLTDGYIPNGQVNRLVDPDALAALGTDARAVAATLVACGLFEQADGGYRIHDFLDYQPSREQVLDGRERERGRWRRRQEASDNCPTERAEVVPAAEPSSDTPDAKNPGPATTTTPRRLRANSARSPDGVRAPSARPPRAPVPGPLNTRATDVALVPARPPNELWDALAAELGDPATRPEKARRGQALKDLAAVGATPDDIHARCAAYRRRWPNIDLTDTALTKHWSTLADQRTPTASSIDPTTGLRLAPGALA